MTIYNITRQTLIADQAEVADGFLARVRGLLGRKSLAPGQALIIQPADSIHTWFMRFPIDVIFLDRQSKVIKIRQSLLPFRFCLSALGASKVIELPCGTLQSSRTQPGDQIMVSDTIF